MSFLHPEFLYYMSIPLLAFFLFILSRKSSQESCFSDTVMEKLRVSANTLTLKTRNWLFLVVAILMLIALSGPIIDEGTIEVKVKSADIMIALDISDSMLAEDVYPNRLKLAKQKALELLKLAPSERIGVIAFARNSYLVSPLSFDSNAVSFLLRELRTDSITEKGTNFLSMLEVVQKSVKKESKKYLLVLSDGGDSEDFSDEIAYAKEKNIVIFVLGLGTSKGAPIKREDGSFLKHNGKILISKLNENISSLATSTGGVYIESVNSNADIKAMLREIEAHSEKKELKSQEIQRYIPLFYYPLGLALLLLLVATSSVGKRNMQNRVAGLMTLLLFGFSPDANAGMMDFMLLNEAKEAYQTQEYKKAQELYTQYETLNKSNDAQYNRANAMYKQGKFKEAQKIYENIKFDVAQKQAKNYANLGNSYVKVKEKGSLKKAVEAYENSLKLQEDKQTRENLEAVKKAMQEQKKKQEKNKDKKDDKKKDDNKDKSNKDKSDKSEKKDKSDKKDKDSKDDKKSDKKSDEEKSKEEKEKKDKDKQDKKEKKNETKELKDNNSTQQVQAKDMKDKMSDEEEKKWLKMLSKKQSTFLYKLNDNNKFEDNTDEKPW
ncbi:MAG TPA: VWA domain-containing protein [Sulfurimonas sp.]|nr:VWA domain-containing protein [Sulfurimonas sp.]